MDIMTSRAFPEKLLLHALFLIREVQKDNGLEFAGRLLVIESRSGHEKPEYNPSPAESPPYS